MNFKDRLEDIRARMKDEKLELLVGLHDGSHLIQKPNPVMVMANFKALGPSAALLGSDGSLDLVVPPHWDTERAAEACADARVIGADDLVGVIAAQLNRHMVKASAIGVVGRRFLTARIADRLAEALPGARDADRIVYEAARIKTSQEIMSARAAARIAEQGFERLGEIARPTMSEDELAVELKWYMKSLGADDNFLMLCASPHNRAVAPSNGRKLQQGDIILAEITPSYRGQLAQICRTVVVGRATTQLADKYRLVVQAMDQGIAAAKPGQAMSEGCRAINSELEAEGYGEYCHPPHIRPRGHGLGFPATRPGAVA